MDQILIKKLDSDASGSTSIAEFISIPDLKENSLVKIVEVEIALDKDSNGKISFEEFEPLSLKHCCKDVY